MNIFVSFSQCSNFQLLSEKDSRVLVTVVPTAIIFFHSFLY